MNKGGECTLRVKTLALDALTGVVGFSVSPRSMTSTTALTAFLSPALDRAPLVAFFHFSQWPTPVEKGPGAVLDQHFNAGPPCRGGGGDDPIDYTWNQRGLHGRTLDVRQRKQL